MSPSPLLAQLEAAGQSHVVRVLETEGARNPEERANLLSQIATFDLDLLARLHRPPLLPGTAGPPDPLTIDRPWPCVPAHERDPFMGERGRAELAHGRVAFALLAGGQASRLRWEGPKGTYPIGPRSERSLFRILVEQVRRAGRDHGAFPLLAVTTSPGTDAAIRRFFESHSHFGMGPARITYACQAALPALDDEGRLLFAERDRLASSPDGHGGAMAALLREGILDQWADRGISTVCTFQVDNPLGAVVDPEFLGRLLESGSPIATKLVRKRDPLEPLGLLVSAGGRPAIVEYSELPEELARATDETGALRYGFGSIAMHAFRLDFLRRELERELPIHRARREISVCSEEGVRGRRMAWKFERFLFDLFPRATSLVAMEVLREREFAPLKNFEGEDSPKSVRRALDAEYRRWYAEAGITPPPHPLLELSPLAAMGPDDLLAAGGA